MKILIATLEFPPFKGGIAVYTKHLAEVLGRDHDVTVVTHHTDHADAQKPGYRLISQPLLGRVIRPRWLTGLASLRALHAKERYDHIITPHILPLGIIALLLRVPYTISLHGMDILMAQRNPWTRLLTRCVLRQAHTILVNSEYTRLQIRHHAMYADKTFVAHPCPDSVSAPDETAVTHLRSKYSLHNTFLLLSVNRLVARKGNDMVIRALALLKRDNLRYVVLGTGMYLDALKTLAQTLGVAHQVLFVHDADDITRSQWYATSDLFVMPARMEGKYDVEGFGISYLEAAQHSVPAIAGAVGGAPEAVLDGITGVLVDPNNPQVLADAIAYLADNPTIRERLGQAARERTRAHFTWDAQFAPYLTRLQKYHEEI